MYVSTLSLSSDTPKEGIGSHYRWLWGAVSALNGWATSPAPVKDFFLKAFKKENEERTRIISSVIGYLQVHCNITVGGRDWETPGPCQPASLVN